MENVPWHREVVSFVQQLADLLPQYDVASEHEHSNCVLIAHKKVRAVCCALHIAHAHDISVCHLRLTDVNVFCID